MELPTPEQFKTLNTAIGDHRLGALFLLMLGLGLRRGEALGLRWQDIDLDARKLRVNRTLQRIGKAIVVGEPKTEKSRRQLTVPMTVVEALRDQRSRQLEARMSAGPEWQNSDDLVFTTATGRPIDPRNVKRSFDALLAGAELPHYRLHDLRHLYASNLLALGVGLKSVSEILGHSKISITADIYAHVSDATIQEEMDKIEAVIG